VAGMMSLLRKKLVKGIFGCLLLSILLLKFFAFSISYLSSSASSYSIEKSAEENRDKEESFDNAKKKLMLYETSVTDHDHDLWSSNIPIRIPVYRIIMGNFPPRNVPTPPPDQLS